MIEYKIDKFQKIIFATITKSITPEDIAVHIIGIVNDPDFSYAYHSIVIIDDNLIIPQIKPEQVENIQDIINGYAKMRKGSKWAVVVSRRTTHAIVQTTLDLIGPLSANIRLFNDTNDALEWVKD